MDNPILVLDIGGTNVKYRISGQSSDEFPSGKQLTPESLIDQLGSKIGNTRRFQVVIGYPGVVRENNIFREPTNLGKGWRDFDFLANFYSVRIINDAAMQAIGAYEGNRMLFLGFGTALGSCLIANYNVVPLQLGILKNCQGKTIGMQLGTEGKELLGEEQWALDVERYVEGMQEAMIADEVVLGGGLAKRIDISRLKMVRICDNGAAFEGGEKLIRDPRFYVL